MRYTCKGPSQNNIDNYDPYNLPNGCIMNTGDVYTDANGAMSLIASVSNFGGNCAVQPFSNPIFSLYIGNP